MRRAATVTTLAAVFILASLVPAGAASLWQPLIDQLVEDGFDRRKVTYVFSSPDLVFSPEIMARKMNVLLNTKLSTAEPGPRPEPEVLDRYLNPLLIAGAYAFYREHRAELAEAHERFGVPGDILTALLLVESKLGTTTGDSNAFTILASMALASNFSLIKGHIERSDISDQTQRWLVRRTEQKARWAYNELKALLRYARANNQDPLSIPSSVYGAIGLCQFMPTSVEHYGRDGSGDGRIDLFEIRDALHSMANYLARHGWKDSLSREEKLRVIYQYNHSESYALTILAVADRIQSTRELFGG